MVIIIDGSEASSSVKRQLNLLSVIYVYVRPVGQFSQCIIPQPHLVQLSSQLEFYAGLLDNNFLILHKVWAKERQIFGSNVSRLI